MCLGQFRFSGPGSKWHRQTVESPRVSDWQGSIKWWEATHSYATEYNVPLHTPSEKAWPYEILLNLNTSIKNPVLNLLSDLCCTGFDSVMLIIIKKINNHISVISWIRWQDTKTVSIDFSVRMCQLHNSYLSDCVSTSGGEKEEEEPVGGGLHWPVGVTFGQHIFFLPIQCSLCN